MRVITSLKSLSPSHAEAVFSRLVRFTYRKSFTRISGTKLTTDSGWGCCFRTGQSVLGQFAFLLKQNFPAEYSAKFGDAHPLSLFRDDPDAPFGIHRLVLEASKVGVPMGEWAKPSLLAQAIDSICRSIGVSCVVSEGFSIAKRQLTASFPALLLIPGLFGLQRFDMAYLPFLHLCLCAPGSLGFVSGKRSSSYYIAGFDAKRFVYFDPHTAQPAMLGEDGFASCFRMKPGMIGFADINPSVLVGFLVASPEALEDLVQMLMACGASPFAVTEDLDENLCDQVLDLDAVLRDEA
jgi:cysteine protease ATG4